MKKSALAMAVLAMSVAVSCKTTTPPPASTAPPVPTQPPPAPAPTSAPVQQSEYDRVLGTPVDLIDRMNLFDEVHFDYDKADIRETDKAAMAKNAATLKKFDFLKVTIEGHCDDRGSVEYNLALGERRAKAASDYLMSLGVPAIQLRTVSYGKEVPVCSDKTEDCWMRNRRGHFTVTEKLKK